MSHNIQNSAISLLGSTGSIGRQTLQVAEQLGLPVLALSANSSIKLLEEQTRKFRPRLVALYSEEAARDFAARVADLDVKVASGMDGLIAAACVDGAQTVVTAVVGTIGLLPTLAAIKLSRRIALANKETLVCAGTLVMSAAKEHNAKIIPVDSEHSALFQCLQGENLKSVQKLILTASGGPFRGKKRSDLLAVSPEQALKHPKWNMGNKISIDSATLMNKGLEIIEAVHIFNIQPDKIEAVIHPQSIIHYMIEYCDNSVMAQLSEPDMCLPIQYALTYPNRKPTPTKQLDLTKLTALTFESPDMDTFPCLSLARQAAQTPGTACAILNAANEAAVDLFLRNKLSFYGISDTVQAALENIEIKTDFTLDDVLETDKAAKEFSYNLKI